MQNNISVRIVVLLTLLSAGACKKFVTIEPAPSLIKTERIFTSDKTALSAASGVYIAMRVGPTLFYNAGMTLYGGLISDEIIPSNPNSDTRAFFEADLVANNTTVTGFYALLYQVIYRCNAALEGLEGSHSLTPGLKDQLIGEMKFVRALQYYYLVNLWDDVPLVTTSDYQVNATLARTPMTKIFEWMEVELKQSVSLLQPEYPSPGKVRPNRWAALMLLARLYQQEKKWDLLEDVTTNILRSGAYSLVPGSSLQNVFAKNSSETVWELASPNETQLVGDATIFVPVSPTVRPAYTLSPGLLNSFEPNDRRGQVGTWVGKNIVNAIEYVYPRKYGQRTLIVNTSPTEYKVVFRLAEAYLLRAEARANMVEILQAQADINKIRERAGLTESAADNKELLLAAIAEERRHEFFCEWGHRWIDLKRTGMSDIVLAPLKSKWQSYDVNFPVPEKELLYNPYLVQNPGF
ncbi:RagB/SusD family nutrient uptake outer membrane protein [Chitinophaga defluvii]|uniref:RagB/SusD family nutrient uptake outer membrane protein n=1 Tax=Chitinophaga defluvii TaxID=3163343 RepID=A0ABV2T8R2_9BACT